MEASGKLSPITIILDDKPNKSPIAQSAKNAGRDQHHLSLVYED